MIKNIIFLIFSFLYFGTDVYADTGASSVTWNNNTVECLSTVSHGVTHYGVPNSNSVSIAAVGTVACDTHAYYTSSDHTITFTYNNGGITACPAGERAISWNGANTITCRKYDDTTPSASDVTSSITDGSYFKAINSVPITITGNNAGGSPITVLQGQFENVDNELVLNSAKSSNSDNTPATSNILETNENLSKVDNYRTVNNYRNYIYNITNICDEAGNCLANPKNFTYNVYANIINSGNSLNSGSANFIGQIANASVRTLTSTFNDVYNNKVVPVYKSDGTTKLRDITFTTNYNNSLYLNQYNKTGVGTEISGIDDSTYVNSLIGGAQSKTTTIIDRANSDGIYNLNFKVYSPTYDSSETNGQQFVYGDFIINNVTAKLSDNAATDTLYTNIDFDFEPLYVTDISGSIKTNGFIVGTTQTGALNITSGGTKNVYLEYGYYDSSFGEPHVAHPKINLNYKKVSTDSWNISSEGYTNPYSSLSLFGTSSSNLITKLIQNGTLSVAETKTYLATHIQTTVGGKTAVYSSDIYGMNRYAGTPTSIDNTLQRGVKILGITHSENQVDIVTGQSTSDISLLGNLQKSYLQRDIRKNAYSLVKEITPNNGSKIISTVNQASPGVRLGNVLYFGGLAGTNVEINLSGNYSGIKTIVVEGGNIYIKGNIIANTKTTDILGIISLKDTSGRGGNIYIHPNVLEVDAILYADRTVATADDTTILQSTDLLRAISPDNGGTYDYLNKQLYIYGTVFSNNTIGGSVQSPYKCPFYITTCDLDTAQKYDMNYLRRGYVTKKVSTYEDYPVIINYNPLIQITPPPLFEKTK